MEKATNTLNANVARKEDSENQYVSSKRILLIEDDEFLVNLMQMKFKREGFPLIVAKNGKEGLKQAKEVKPDIILLDIILPDLNGFSVLEQIKANETIQSIPVIILSNLSQPENIKKGMGLGAKDYLVKVQHTPQEIIDRVKSFLTA